jgi:dihydroflavonol-4-reductase
MTSTHHSHRTTPGLALVTGANGHLGNTLVRSLLARGHAVRAGVRRLNDDTPFLGLPCERVHVELLVPHKLRRPRTRVDLL